MRCKFFDRGELHNRLPFQGNLSRLESVCQQKLPQWKLFLVSKLAIDKKMKWYERAKEIMKQDGVTNADLARALGESESNVSRWLAGERSADSLALACRFATALDISPVQLIFGEESKLIDIERSPPWFRRLSTEQRRLLECAANVLRSGKPCAGALVMNISIFHDNMEENSDLQKRVGKLEEDLQKCKPNQSELNDQGPLTERPESTG